MNILPEIKEKPYICELKQFRKRRSLDANAYFHVLVDKIAKENKKSAEEVKISLNLDYGTIARDENGLKVGFKALDGVPIEKFFKYAKPIGYEIENGKKFIKYIVYKETHTLDSAEMAFSPPMTKMFFTLLPFRMAAVSLSTGPLGAMNSTGLPLIAATGAAERASG